MEISRVLYSDQRYVYEVHYTPDVVFAHRETGDLKLQILSPIKPEVHDEVNRRVHTRPEMLYYPENHKFPCLIDVPGSGWHGAQGYDHVPKMVEIAKEGFVVACIEYRGTEKDNVRFPAAVQDAKEAIRFMRAHAEEYHIDPDHVCILGDSSGGHTAAMAALTGSEERFNIGDNLDQPTNVNACVMFYGPNDLLNLVPDRLAEGKTLREGEGEFPTEAWEIFGEDFKKDPEGMLADASPINYISADKKLPPFLFLQGEDDPIIPMAQGLRFCQKIRDCGGKAEFVKICGAGHNDGCWTAEAMELVKQFLKTYY